MLHENWSVIGKINDFVFFVVFLFVLWNDDTHRKQKTIEKGMTLERRHLKMGAPFCSCRLDKCIRYRHEIDVEMVRVKRFMSSLILKHCILLSNLIIELMQSWFEWRMENDWKTARTMKNRNIRRYSNTFDKCVCVCLMWVGRWPPVQFDVILHMASERLTARFSDFNERHPSLENGRWHVKCVILIAIAKFKHQMTTKTSIWGVTWNAVQHLAKKREPAYVQ